MKTRTLVGILAAGVIGNLAAENMGPEYQDCEVYQGAISNNEEGRVNFVFDPLDLYSRVAGPKYSLEGDPKLEDKLKIGKEYCFTYLDPLAPWASKKLREIEQPGSQTN